MIEILQWLLMFVMGIVILFIIFPMVVYQTVKMAILAYHQATFIFLKNQNKKEKEQNEQSKRT